jgi:hypothetical protein
MGNKIPGEDVDAIAMWIVGTDMAGVHNFRLMLFFAGANISATGSVSQCNRSSTFVGTWAIEAVPVTIAYSIYHC